jgi:hypothetical protein
MDGTDLLLALVEVVIADHVWWAWRSIKISDDLFEARSNSDGPRTYGRVRVFREKNAGYSRFSTLNLFLFIHTR